MPTAAWAKTHHKKLVLVHHSVGVDRGAPYSDIVIDAETGEILHESDPDGERHPASLTKMMTLYLTFQAIEMGRLGINQYLPVSNNAAEQEPSKLGLHAGQRIRVEDAILGVVTESANDAAMALGEWLGGSEENFGQMMTRQAKALGMEHTHFENPTGLPNPDQVTTAHDMAILGQSLMYHFPRFYSYFSHENFVYGGISHHNHNHLMSRYDGMDGIKTGYIRASGFNLVASAKHGDTRLIGVVFGGRSALARDNRMAILLDQSFAAMANENRGIIQNTLSQAQATSHLAAMAPAADSAATSVDAPIAQGDGADTQPSDEVGYVALPNKASAGSLQLPPTPTPKTPKGNEFNGDNWGVQIGAYNNLKSGQVALASLVHAMPQLLGSAKPVVEKISGGKTGTLYRARLMGLDPKTAQAVCAYMTQNQRNCLTVGP